MSRRHPRGLDPGGNIFGICAPIVTGYIIAYTGSYNGAFIVGGLLVLCDARAAIQP